MTKVGRSRITSIHRLEVNYDIDDLGLDRLQIDPSRHDQSDALANGSVPVNLNVEFDK